MSSVAAAEEKPIGQVVWVKGILKATQPEKTGRDLTRRSPVFEKDTLSTDAKSTGQIVFTDSTILALRESTTLALTKYKYGKGTPPKDATFVANLAKGGFRTITGAIAKDNPDGYQANTPVAIIGVTGTGFDFVLSSKKSTKLSMNCQIGTCTLTNSAGKQVLNKEHPFAIVECSASGTKKTSITSPDFSPSGTCFAPKIVATLPAELKVSPQLVSATFKPDAKPVTTKQPSETGIKTEKVLKINMPCG